MQKSHYHVEPTKIIGKRMASEQEIEELSESLGVELFDEGDDEDEITFKAGFSCVVCKTKKVLGAAMGKCRIQYLVTECTTEHILLQDDY